jgi:hypothetical protein
MKGPPTRDDDTRFRGGIRHYHRSKSQRDRSWDEWIDGESSNTRPIKHVAKVVGITLAVIALCAVIVGLLIELR